MQEMVAWRHIEMIRWTLHSFHSLRPEALYQAMVLRQRVFVVEQACAYLDCDGLDPQALHLVGLGSDGALLAYARLLGPGVKYDEASIGRVVVDPSVRARGIGRELVRQAVHHARATYGGPLHIGAQLHLEGFYREFGFVRCGLPYTENGIPHVGMRLA